MYIRKVNKKNKNSQTIYSYYRLVHGYKVGNKVRQQTLLNLGKLEELPVEKHKALADRIEELLTGVESLFQVIDEDIEILAQKFTSIINKQEVFASKKSKIPLAKDLEDNYQEIDINSIEEEESREIGGEWLCKQAFDKLGINNLLKSIGMNNDQIKMAQMLLISKLIHPSSELESERWLKENSGSLELYNVKEYSITRYKLYQVGLMMYHEKEFIEKELFSTFSGLFSQRNKIVIYDLTNMFFEGQMYESIKAMFGRSKEKRSDCRLISLSLAIDSRGFVRHSQIYPGNISEPATLDKMLMNVKETLNYDEDKPVIVMDAGIATEENLDRIKSLGYDYVCVSRKHPKSYDKLTDKATFIQDSVGNTIEVQKVLVEGSSDSFLHIRSDQKVVKEESMDRKITQRFEERLNYLRDGLSLPRRTKKIIPVHEAIGRIKNQFSKVAKLYKIEYEEDKKKGIVTKIKWIRQSEKEKPKGEYFLRYSRSNLLEKEIWDVYNLTREVEASFRCLKTDLNIRPIHHQKDTYIEPHIWLGIFAYQIVNYIQQSLHENNIKRSWSSIVEKMKTQKCSLITMNTKSKKRILVKLCTRPNEGVKKIYSALSFKDRPYVRKTKVVTQM